MKRDIVYIIGDKSEWNDNELRYSLRSLMQFGRNFGKIVIVGYCPDWLDTQLVTVIPVADEKNKTYNIMNKVRVAAQSEAVSDDFIYFCDDYILFDTIYFDDYEGFVEYKTITDMLEYMRVNNRTNWWWYKVMTNTVRQLKKQGLDENNYGIHVPVVYNSATFLEMLQRFDFDTPDDGIEVCTAYGNFAGKELPRTRDNKFKIPPAVLQYVQEYMTNDYPPLFSLSPNLTDEMKAFVQGMFLFRSQYELY